MNGVAVAEMRIPLKSTAKIVTVNVPPPGNGTTDDGTVAVRGFSPDPRRSTSGNFEAKKSSVVVQNVGAAGAFVTEPVMVVVCVAGSYVADVICGGDCTSGA